MEGPDASELVVFGGAVVAVVGAVVISLVVAALSLVLPLGFALRFHRAVAKSRERERWLLATGKAAPATVLAVAETGWIVNQRPELRITLQVVPDDAPVFQTRIDRIVSMLAIPRIQPGQVLEVRYDPEMPEHLVLVGL